MLQASFSALTSMKQKYDVLINYMQMRPPCSVQYGGVLDHPDGRGQCGGWQCHHGHPNRSNNSSGQRTWGLRAAANSKLSYSVPIDSPGASKVVTSALGFTVDLQRDIKSLWYGICSGIRVYQCVQAQHVREIVSGEDSRSLGVVKHLWTRQCGSSHSFSGNATVAETVAESVVDAADVGLRASPASSTPLSCEASSSRRLWACSIVQIRLLKLRRG